VPPRMTRAKTNQTPVSDHYSKRSLVKTLKQPIDAALPSNYVRQIQDSKNK
jgi:hypothetical protein